MTMKDTELESWRTLWSAEQPVNGADRAAALDAARIVAHGRRRLVIRMTLEAIVAIVWIAVAVVLIRLRPDPALMVLGAGIIAFVAVACGFSVWNATGVWQPASESVRDFVLIAQERCRRDLRAVQFGLWFAAIEIVLLCGWLWWTRGRDVLPELSGQSSSWMMILPVAAPLAVVGWLLRWRWRARRELAALDLARRQFEAD